MRTVVEIAKLAGLLEGEGSFGLQSFKDTVRVYPRLSFASTDEDVARWVAERLGARVIYRQPPKAYGAIVGTKPAYAVVISGARAAAWMMTCYVFLGARRRAKIREVLNKWRQFPPHPASRPATERALMGIPRRTRAECHPERRHQARGLCTQCYAREWQRTRRALRRSTVAIGRHEFLRG
jgi:hypothetical protein